MYLKLTCQSFAASLYIHFLHNNYCNPLSLASAEHNKREENHLSYCTGSSVTLGDSSQWMCPISTGTGRPSTNIQSVEEEIFLAYMWGVIIITGCSCKFMKDKRTLLYQRE